MLAQHLFERPRLVIAPVQDGEVAVARALGEAAMQYLGHHLLGLGLGVLAGQHADGFAVAQFAPQALLEHVRVVGDEPVGALEDAAAGPVVLFQLDDLQARIVLLQPAQVLRACAAPGVDGLVVVADGGEVAEPADQQPHQLVLGAIGVLVFIHQQVADPVLPVFARLGIPAEQCHRCQDQVVEVEGVVGLEAALVLQVELRRGQGEGLAGPGQRRLGVDAVVLPVRDLPTGAVRVEADAGLAHQFVDQVAAVLGIEDGEARLEAQPGVFAAKDVQAQGMEGGQGQAPPRAPFQQPADPFPHFPGGLVGEGDGHDVPGRQPALPDQVGDLVGDDTGLAAAGAGQHQQGAIDVADGGALGGVQVRHGGTARGRDAAGMGCPF